MEAQESPLDQIISHTEDYLKTRQQLTQHVITEKVVVLTSTMVTACVLFAFFVIAALFASLGLAGWISRSMDDPLAGYWVLASAYALIGLLFILLRKVLLKKPLMNAMVRNIYNAKNHG